MEHNNVITPSDASIKSVAKLIHTLLWRDKITLQSLWVPRLFAFMYAGYVHVAIKYDTVWFILFCELCFVSCGNCLLLFAGISFETRLLIEKWVKTYEPNIIEGSKGCHPLLPSMMKISSFYLRNYWTIYAIWGEYRIQFVFVCLSLCLSVCVSSDFCLIIDLRC